MTQRLQLHASCVSIAGRGVLLLGDSGSGKSDLALRLIDDGAMLMGDDQVVLVSSSSQILASPAPRLEGLIEARGVGIMRLPYITDVPLALAVKLVAQNAVERMPEPEFFDCLGIKLPLLSLHAFESSTPAKIRHYLACISP